MESNQNSQITHCKIWPLINIKCKLNNSNKGPTYLLWVSSNSLLLIKSNSFNEIRPTFQKRAKKKEWTKKKKELLLKSKKLD